MDRKLILDFDRKQKQLKQQKSKQHHGAHKDSGRKDKKPKFDEEPETPSTSTIYRDRAKERREGINKDFELDPDELLISNPIVDGSEDLDDVERRKQQIEDSKYLGGDVEHTHLVKGLDFALLEKIKSAEKLAEKNDDDARKLEQGFFDDTDFRLAGSDSDEEAFTREAIKAATATATSKRQIDIEKLRTSDMIPCKLAKTRRLLEVLDDARLPNKSDPFKTGDVSYVISLDTETDTCVTEILRSKAEQAEKDTPVNEKDLAFDQLINIFGKIRNKK